MALLNVQPLHKELIVVAALETTNSFLMGGEGSEQELFRAIWIFSQNSPCLSGKSLCSDETIFTLRTPRFCDVKPPYNGWE